MSGKENDSIICKVEANISDEDDFEVNNYAEENNSNVNLLPMTSSDMESIKTLILECHSQLLSKVNDLCLAVDSINVRLKALEEKPDKSKACLRASTTDAYIDLNGKLPLTTLNSFWEFEEKLSDQAYMQNMSQFMQTLGGRKSSSHELIQNIFKKFISDSLAQRFNVEGRNKVNTEDKKTPLKDTKFLSCVFLAARLKNNTEVNEAALKTNCIGPWLTGATLRIKRELGKKRKHDSNLNDDSSTQ